MRRDDTHDELSGIRGFRLYKFLKAVFSRTVGRAWLYDHVTAGVDYAMSVHRRRRRPLVYYEFGTGSGNTLQRALYAMRNYEESHVVLFDSFQGLPEPAHVGDFNPFWSAGDFAFSEDYVRRLIERVGFPLERVRFVPGFFEQSLTLELQNDLRSIPPSFVTIDVDYYTSTALALSFLKPLLGSGAVIFFDDLGAFDGHPDYGQVKALREFNAQNPDGMLVPHPVLGNRMFVYYRHNYEYRETSRLIGAAETRQS